VAIASAVATRNAALRDAVIADAGAEVSGEVIDDAVAAAALMAMNNVYYRFRHLVGKPSYSQMPARLRMQRIAKPLTNKADFELFCLAVSAINGCEMCIRSHEEVVLKGGNLRGAGTRRGEDRGNDERERAVAGVAGLIWSAATPAAALLCGGARVCPPAAAGAAAWRAATGVAALQNAARCSSRVMYV
jgi:AhpD family alkylhydroperoxidase